MSATPERESVEEPVLRQFHPKPFHQEALDPEKIVIYYDRRSDTLLVHLFGRGRSSISVPVDRYLYAMVIQTMRKSPVSTSRDFWGWR